MASARLHARTQMVLHELIEESRTRTGKVIKNVHEALSILQVLVNLGIVACTVRKLNTETEETLPEAVCANILDFVVDVTPQPPPCVAVYFPLYRFAWGFTPTRDLDIVEVLKTQMEDEIRLTFDLALEYTRLVSIQIQQESNQCLSGCISLRLCFL